MSTQIDNRVVEMQFDNRQFEAGVATSMSTLDKLKSKLNLMSSAKGLENISASAKKCDLSPLNQGVETARLKFSALQVMGTTALANITNSAVNAGKRIASALTIDPIRSGLAEYETQINAVQTILANTQKEGTNIKQVNAALDELNAYADKTIYNFTEMTRNIGTFTAAGVKLDTSVNAIQGIANLAAVSGSTSQQASTAMYQLSQALAAGTVKLMDWNSVVNAGMGGQVFQDALKETSRELQTGADAAIEAYGSFRESLRSGWLTSEVLTQTLKKFTTSGANEYVAKYTGLSKEAVEASLKSAEAKYGEAEAIDKASEALAAKSGKNKEEIKEILQFAKTAEDAATKVKTFTQLWDVLKEAAQSGWAQTWRLIIGDFEEAKAIFTPLSNFLTGIINGFSDARNSLLESALGKGFGKLSSSVAKVFGPMEKAIESTQKVTSAISDLGKVVDEVILGKFGNGMDRVNKLTEAGQNYYKVQNEVNKKLGNGFRYSEEKIAEQEKALQAQTVAADSSAKATSKASGETAKLTNEQKKQIKTLAKMSEEQLRSAGYTEEQIDTLNELKSAAEKIGVPFDKFIDKIDEINGRWLLINSFKNIGQAIVKVFSSIGKAFRDVFDPIKPTQLFNAIGALNKFTSELIISDKTAEKLRSTFRGLFTILDMVATVLGAGLKIGFAVVSTAAKLLGSVILNVTSVLGDMVYKMGQWFDGNNPLPKFIESLTEKLPVIVDKIKEFMSEFYIDSGLAENFKTIADALEHLWNIAVGKFMLSWPSALKVLNNVLAAFGTNLGQALVKLSEWVIKVLDWVDANTFLMHATQKVSDIIVIFVKGLKDCFNAFMALEPVQKFIKNFTKNIQDFFSTFSKGFDGSLIETLTSALTNAFEAIQKWIESLKDSEHLGRDIVSGIAKGIRSGVQSVVSAIVEIGQSIIDAFCSLLGIHSPSTVFMGFGRNIIQGLVNGIKSLFTSPITLIANLGRSIISAFKGLFSIGGSSMLLKGLGVAGIFAGIIGVITKFAPKIKSALGDVSKIVGDFVAGFFDGFDLSMVAVFTFLGTLMYLGKKALDVADKIVSPLTGINNVLNSFADRIKVDTMMAKSKAIWNVAKSIAILAAAFALLSTLSWPEIGKAAASLGIITALLVGSMIAISKLANGLNVKDVAKISGYMIAFSAALGILALAMKVFSGIELTWSTVGSIVLMVTAMGALLYAFGKILGDNIGNADVGKNISKAAWMFVKMAIGIGLMAVAIKMMASVPVGDIAKATAVVTVLGILFAAFIAVANKSKGASAAGSLMLKMAVALAIIPFVIKTIADISMGDIVKGLAVITAIGALFALFTKTTKLMGKEAVTSGNMMLKVAGSMLLIATAMKMLGSMDGEDMIKALAAIVAIEAIFLAFFKLTKGIGKFGGAGFGTSILSMTGGLVLIAVAMRLLASISVGDIVKGIAVIAALEVMMGAMAILTRACGPWIDKAGTMLLKMSIGILVLSGAIAILGYLDPAKVARGTACVLALMAFYAGVLAVSYFAKSCEKTILAIAASIGVLAIAIMALSLIDKERCTNAAKALSMVMVAFSALLAVTRFAGDIGMKGVKNMAPLLLLVAGLVAVVFALSKLDADASMQSAVAISSLLIAMSVSMKILDSMGNLSVSVKSLGLMLVVVSGVAAILGVLSHLNVEPAISSATAISILLLVLAASMKIMSTITSVSPQAILAMAAVTVIVGLVAGILGVLKALDVEPSIETATAISILLIAMTAVTAALTVIGAAAPVAIAGAGAFAAVVGILGTLMVAIGALMTYVPACEEFLNKGISVLEKIGQGIGKFVGGIVGGIAEGVMSTLPEIGRNIAEFAKSIGSVSPESMQGVQYLADAILTLTGANFIDGLAKLNPLASSLEELSTTFPAMGTAIRGFVDNLGVLGPDQVSAVQCAADAIKILAKAGSEIDGQAEWTKGLFGDNSIATFADQLPAVGRSISEFASSLNISADGIESVRFACEAIKMLAKAGTDINGQSDFGIAFFGDDSLQAFTYQLPAVGRSLSAFATSLGTFTPDQVTSVQCACDAIKALSKAGSGLNGQAEWSKALFGDNGIGAFSAQLPAFASNLRAFVSNLGTFGEEQVTSVNSAVKVVKAFANLGDANLGALNNILPDLGDKLTAFAKDLVKFCNEIGKIGSEDVAAIASSLVDTVANLANNLKKSASGLKSVGTDIAKNIAAGLRSGKANISSAATTAVSGAKSAITATKGQFESAGKTLASSMVKGIESKKGAAKTAGKALAESAKSGASSASMRSAGVNLGQGLVNGINAMKTAAYNAGYALGQAAVQGEKDGQKSKSPSRLTYQAGIWIGEGLVNGMVAMGKAVYNTGRDIGETATGALSRAISNVGQFLDGDIDVNPTITPVVDLSNVKSGVGTINGLLGQDVTFAANATLSAINFGMNRRNQNDANEDVIFAIDNLRREVSNISKPTYEVGGITYDAGSAVEEAVQQLIRAANIERRS